MPMLSLSNILLFLVLILFLAYLGTYLFLRRKIQKKEKEIIEHFLKKIEKIPALIEVMRDLVHDPAAFTPITTLHSESIIRDYRGIFLLLEENMKIQREFYFLMKLSAHIPELQKREYFLYIRQFILQYEEEMEELFSEYDALISRWNIFINIKN